MEKLTSHRKITEGSSTNENSGPKSLGVDIVEMFTFAW